LKIEQTGPNKVKITLETDLEKSTIGCADKIEVTMEQVSSIGYKQVENIKSLEVEKEKK